MIYNNHPLISKVPRKEVPSFVLHYYGTKIECISTLQETCFLRKNSMYSMSNFAIAWTQVSVEPHEQGGDLTNISCSPTTLYGTRIRGNFGESDFEIT